MAEQEKKTVDIGQKIYEIRKSEGLSQTEFAEKFHVTRQTVSNWEHGKNYPDMEILIKISDEYGITFDELIKSDKELIRSIDRNRRVASKSMLIFAVLGVLVIGAVLIKLCHMLSDLLSRNIDRIGGDPFTDKQIIISHSKYFLSYVTRDHFIPYIIV